jgi:2-polyprenyl-6-methoxyphenol hydroxylase-like FAD-dependent oxidoreductase
MTTQGRVVVIGAGPAGMAAALSLVQTEHEVILIERYKEARPAGNILNLWPPPIQALEMMGVETKDLGAPCQSQFRRADGKVRAIVNLPAKVVEKYGGGFIGMLRPQLYKRMLAALPAGVVRFNTQVERMDQDQSGVRLTLTDGTVLEADVVIGADGIDSFVRKSLWGDKPKREHNLHIVGGFTFADDLNVPTGQCIVSHTSKVQGSWTAIMHEGRAGFQWWVLEGYDGLAEFHGDLHEHATRLASEFSFPLPELVAATPKENLQRWVIRDRPALKQWSQGRVTLVGDAAHPTSPYAAYGAGMSIEDGFFLGRKLSGIDLKDYQAVSSALQEWEEPRKKHTAFQVDMAYKLGQMFHHAPAALRPLRDFVFDKTPFLQKMIGEKTPGEIVDQIAEVQAAEDKFGGKKAA